MLLPVLAQGSYAGTVLSVVGGVCAIVFFVLRGAHESPRRHAAALIAANVFFCLTMGGMMVLTALGSRHRIQSLGVPGAGDAADNSLIPPLIFGGGLLLVLVVNIVGLAQIRRRLADAP
jgi:hypothetical protein